MLQGFEAQGGTVVRPEVPVVDPNAFALDVRNLLGSATHVDTLLEAGCDRADLFIAATNVDEVNLLSASLASGVGARALLKDVVPLWLAQVTASVLILFAGFCLVAAVWRHLWRAVPPPTTDVKPMPRGALVPINLFLLLVAAAALFGIWS